MKGKLTFLLAMVLSLSLFFSMRTAVSAETGNVGQVDVSIGTALIMERDVEFTVRLTDSRQESRTQTLRLEKNAAGESRVSFEGLADGEYALEVSGQGSLF